MQTIFRADLRKLQSSDSCIPRHLLSHGLAAVRAPVAPKEAAGLGGPKPSTRPDRRGLETGGRDLPRRTGLGRVTTNSSVPSAGCIWSRPATRDLDLSPSIHQGAASTSQSCG